MHKTGWCIFDFVLKQDKKEKREKKNVVRINQKSKFYKFDITPTDITFRYVYTKKKCTRNLMHFSLKYKIVNSNRTDPSALLLTKL